MQVHREPAMHNPELHLKRPLGETVAARHPGLCAGCRTRVRLDDVVRPARKEPNRLAFRLALAPDGAPLICCNVAIPWSGIPSARQLPRPHSVEAAHQLVRAPPRVYAQAVEPAAV